MIYRLSILYFFLFLSLPSKVIGNEVFFIPPDINQAFQKIDIRDRALHCGNVSDFFLSELEEYGNLTPPKKIEGFNSRMDNRDDVIGAEEADIFFLRLSQASTAAVFADDEEAARIALSGMKNWAMNDALTQTKHCYSQNGIEKSCGKAWKRKDGQDLAPTMDSGKVQAFMNHASYAYFGGLEKIDADESAHQAISKWLRVFQSKNKGVSKPFFGFDFGWYWPAIFKNQDKGSDCLSKDCPKKLIQRLIKELDEVVLPDGSLKDRTTRGDRALHYHNEAMNEVIMTLELARKFGVEIPKELHQKVQKSGDIFANGFFDHTYMDKWAKVAHNSKYTPGKQKFKSDINNLTYGTSWYFVFAYRYPSSTLAKKLNEMFEIGTKTAKVDVALGIGVGCVYRALISQN